MRKGLVDQAIGLGMQCLGFAAVIREIHMMQVDPMVLVQIAKDQIQILDVASAIANEGDLPHWLGISSSCLGTEPGRSEYSTKLRTAIFLELLADYVGLSGGRKRGRRGGFGFASARRTSAATLSDVGMERPGGNGSVVVVDRRRPTIDIARVVVDRPPHMVVEARRDVGPVGHELPIDPELQMTGIVVSLAHESLQVEPLTDRNLGIAYVVRPTARSVPLRVEVRAHRPVGLALKVEGPDRLAGAIEFGFQLEDIPKLLGSVVSRQIHPGGDVDLLGEKGATGIPALVHPAEEPRASRLAIGVVDSVLGAVGA